MVFVILIAVFCLYVGLYLVWEGAKSHLSWPMAILHSINELFSFNDDVIYVILRGLFFAALFYVVADFFFSSARRLKRHEDKERHEDKKRRQAKEKTQDA